MWELKLSKDRFKFSASHFTRFSAGEKERLHGHNYYVSLSLRVSQLNQWELGFDFPQIKRCLEQCLEDLDEKVLLPKTSEAYEVQANGDQVDVEVSGDHYSFPARDVYFLPYANVSLEVLAEYVCESFLAKQAVEGDRIRVEVEESRGQSIEFTKEL